MLRLVHLISSYGEATFLAFQTFLIGWMAIALEVSQIAGFAFVALYGAALAMTLSPIIPMSVLYTLQTLNVPIMLSSKFLQIMVNWRNGSTGQLSAITLLLFALGSTARIFTSIQETGDNLIILTYILSTLCNYILVAQLLYYWKSPIRSTETTEKNSKLKKN
ncbi:Mannose-P-dolichol utilization defect 1 [Paragonimus heterotremus]|uniref:Mannose-P-dolichol utilization defect 1 n=1 Tax=Paragonimus heterotremus TaxID=100268 RepID=A0A8J4SEX9_9TREM|nr:Mannose-P-dolichol utilization defect 1 [Paragonimus heterotremus]